MIVDGSWTNPGLLGRPYSVNEASYDLARLRRNGLISRGPNANTYDLPPDGPAFAIFYTKLHDQVLGPLLTTGNPPASPRHHHSSVPHCTPSSNQSPPASPPRHAQPGPVPALLRLSRSVLPQPDRHQTMAGPAAAHGDAGRWELGDLAGALRPVFPEWAGICRRNGKPLADASEASHTRMLVVDDLSGSPVRLASDIVDRAQNTGISPIVNTSDSG